MVHLKGLAFLQRQSEVMKAFIKECLTSLKRSLAIYIVYAELTGRWLKQGWTLVRFYTTHGARQCLLIRVEAIKIF